MSLGVRRVSETEEDMNKISRERVSVKFIWECGCGKLHEVLQPSREGEIDFISLKESCNNCGKEYEICLTNPEVVIKPKEE